ncbi:MAG: TSUP family transporter, partial [Alphaproteobacteria bacterium]
SFVGKAPRIPERGRGAMGFGAGGATGLIGGMTGVFGPILAIYTLSLHMAKDAFVWAMGVLLLLASSGLGVSYAILGALPGWVVVASLGAIAPAYAGMYAGSCLRRVISPILFRNIILTILGLIACKHIAGSLGLV